MTIQTKRTILGLLIALTIFGLLYAFVDTRQTRSTIVKNLPTLSESIDVIWLNECNNGIYFRGKCVCPAFFEGEQCEIGTEQFYNHLHKDNCTNRVDYQLYDPWKDSLKEKSSSCPYSPAAIHCNRDAITKKDSIKNVTINDFYTDYDKLSYIFEYYGPWSEQDKLMWHYLLQPQDFGESVPIPDSKNSLAFVFMLHKDPTVFSLMWPYIYRPHHHYVIHLDSKMHSKYVEIVHKTVEKNNGNVEILSESFYGSWGTISLVYMELAAISRLVHKKGSWSHVINLSGDDFIIKPIERIEQSLAPLHRFSFISVDKQTEIRQNTTWINCPNPDIVDSNRKMVSWYKDNPTNKLSFNYARSQIFNTTYPFKGSQWHILSREVAEMAVKNLSAIELLMSMKYTLIPDEYFFILLIKHYELPMIQNDKRWVRWPEKKVEVKDIPSLQNSDKFFARKVKPDVIPSLVKSLLQ